MNDQSIGFILGEEDKNMIDPSCEFIICLSFRWDNRSLTSNRITAHSLSFEIFSRFTVSWHVICGFILLQAHETVTGEPAADKKGNGSWTGDKLPFMEAAYEIKWAASSNETANQAFISAVSILKEMWPWTRLIIETHLMEQTSQLVTAYDWVSGR